jgi:hypothetical protein
MMQVTRAAFQAFASLNKQATDPKSHSLVSNFYTRISPVPLPAIPMVDPFVLDPFVLCDPFVLLTPLFRFVPVLCS